VVNIPSSLKEVSRDRASGAWIVTINKVSNVEIRIKVKAFGRIRIRKFVDIVNTPLFKKSFRSFIFNPPFFVVFWECWEKVLIMDAKSL
jgi:hypothetical protein